MTCGEGEMYLCAVRDEHSKRVLGWSVADHMLTELVTDALAQAVAVRAGQVGGTIMHSDRGTQYTARAMVQACADAGLRRSMGATGICWDNSGAESLWSTFKHEYYYRHVFATKSELVAAVDKWMHLSNHSDRGTQYKARARVQACADAGLRRSMRATGICWDNSGAESLWSTFKHEYY